MNLERTAVAGVVIAAARSSSEDRRFSLSFSLFFSLLHYFSLFFSLSHTFSMFLSLSHSFLSISHYFSPFFSLLHSFSSFLFLLHFFALIYWFLFLLFISFLLSLVCFILFITLVWEESNCSICCSLNHDDDDYKNGCNFLICNLTTFIVFVFSLLFSLCLFNWGNY